MKDQRYSEVDIKTLSNQRDMLLDKLEEFELANKNLRRLLRETQKKRVGKKGPDELEKPGRIIIFENFYGKPRKNISGGYTMICHRPTWWQLILMN